MASILEAVDQFRRANSANSAWLSPMRPASLATWSFAAAT